MKSIRLLAQCFIGEVSFFVRNWRVKGLLAKALLLFASFIFMVDFASQQLLTQGKIGLGEELSTEAMSVLNHTLSNGMYNLSIMVFVSLLFIVSRTIFSFHNQITLRKLKG